MALSFSTRCSGAEDRLRPTARRPSSPAPSKSPRRPGAGLWSLRVEDLEMTGSPDPRPGVSTFRRIGVKIASSKISAVPAAADMAEFSASMRSIESLPVIVGVGPISMGTTPSAARSADEPTGRACPKRSCRDGIVYNQWIAAIVSEGQPDNAYARPFHRGRAWRRLREERSTLSPYAAIGRCIPARRPTTQSGLARALARARHES